MIYKKKKYFPQFRVFTYYIKCTNSEAFLDQLLNTYNHLIKQVIMIIPVFQYFEYRGVVIEVGKAFNMFKWLNFHL